MYKKLIIVLIVAFASLVVCNAATEGKKVPRSEIKSIVKEFKRYDEFEGLTIGKFWLNLLKSVEKLSPDEMDDDEKEEMQQFFKLMKSIDGLIVADYEDCSAEVKSKFNARMSKALEGVELLMEEKDEDDVVRIYGYVNKDGTEIKDLVLFSPGEGNFMCMLGILKMENLEEMVKSSK